MDRKSAFLLSTAALGGAAALHAAWAWGPVPAVRFVAVAVAVAFVAELAAVRAGLLVHHTGPQIVGVPAAALLGWVGSIYVAYAAVGVVVAGPARPVAAGLLATAADVVADPHGVDDGLWTYPESAVSAPRYRGVPWWNFVGWFVLTAGVSALAAP